MFNRIANSFLFFKTSGGVFWQMMPLVCNTMEKSTKINNWHLKKNIRQNIHVLYTYRKYVQLNCRGKTVNLRSYSGKSGTQYATFR